MDEGSGVPFTMPVAPAGGYGNGFGGFGGDGWWILLLLLFAGGWGGGFGGGYGGIDFYPWMNQSNQISDGFRDQMLSTQISGIQNSITSGFGDVQTALCNGFNSTNVGILNAVNGIESQLASCCCENRLATVQTQNVVATEGAATRLAIQQQTQAILDKMCQDKIDAKNEKIVELNARINALESNNYIQNALTAQTQYIVGLYPPPAAAAI